METAPAWSVFGLPNVPVFSGEGQREREARPTASSATTPCSAAHATYPVGLGTLRVALDRTLTCPPGTATHVTLNVSSVRKREGCLSPPARNRECRRRRMHFRYCWRCCRPAGNTRVLLPRRQHRRSGSRRHLRGARGCGGVRAQGAVHVRPRTLAMCSRARSCSVGFGPSALQPT
jgi:hypothetical protein